MANETGQAGVSEDMGGEREMCLLSESTHYIIDATRGEASPLFREEERRFVSLRNPLLALFQPGV